MRPSWVFFDAGNTLIGLEYARLIEALGAAGFVTDETALRRAERSARRALDAAIIARWREGNVPRTGWVEARVWHAYWAGALAAAGAPADRLDPLTQVVLEVTRPASSWTRLAPATCGVLTSLAESGLKLAIISNSSGTLEGHLRSLDLRRHFSFVIDSHHAGVEKPHPDIFRLALERAGAAPAADALYVGDVYAIDVLGARGAGLRALLLDPEGQWDESLAPPGEPPCHTLSSLEDLPALVEAARAR